MLAHSCTACGADPTTRRLMPLVLQAFLVAFGVVFLAELPDKTMFATDRAGNAIPATAGRRGRRDAGDGVPFRARRRRRRGAAASAAQRRLSWVLPRCSSVGGVLLLRSGGDDDDVQAAPVHGAWGVVGRTAVIIGIAEFGDFTQLATIGIVADRGYPVAVAAGSLVAHIVVAILAVLAGRWLERRLPVRTVQRAAGVLFIVFGVLDGGLGDSQLTSISATSSARLVACGSVGEHCCAPARRPVCSQCSRRAGTPACTRRPPTRTEPPAIRRRRLVSASCRAGGRRHSHQVRDGRRLHHQGVVRRY